MSAPPPRPRATPGDSARWTALVQVTLKPAVNDPQGLAIRGGLHQLGFETVESVRAGKSFRIELDAPTRAAAEGLVDSMCRKLLANPVIEDFTFELAETTRAPVEG